LFVHFIRYLWPAAAQIRMRCGDFPARSAFGT